MKNKGKTNINTYQKMTNIIKQQVKKVALAVILVVAFWGVADAQTGQAGSGYRAVSAGETSGPVKLNVVLNPIRTLIVGQNEVNLEYRTVEDYSKGVSHTTTGGHLQVTNIGGGYKIYVKSTASELKHSAEKSIDGSGVTVSGVSQGAGIKAYTHTIRDLHANGNGEVLFHVENAVAHQATARAFEVTYTAAGGNAYTDKVSGSEPMTYTVDVMYTILSE